MMMLLLVLVALGGQCSARIHTIPTIDTRGSPYEVGTANDAELRYVKVLSATIAAAA